MHVPCSCSMSAGWSSHWGQLIPVRDFKDHLKKYHSGVWAHLVGSAKNGDDPLSASSSTLSSATRDLDQSQPSEVSDPGFGGQRNDVLEVLLPSPIDSSIQHQQSRRLRPLPCHPHLVGKTLTRRLLPQLDGSANSKPRADFNKARSPMPATLAPPRLQICQHSPASGALRVSVKRGPLCRS